MRVLGEFQHPLVEREPAALPVEEPALGQLVAVDIGFVRVRVRVEVGVEVGGGGNPPFAEATVCGRCAAIEPTEGCAACWTGAWALALAHGPLFRAEGPWGASDGTEIAGIARSLPGISRCGGSARLAAS